LGGSSNSAASVNPNFLVIAQSLTEVSFHGLAGGSQDGIGNDFTESGIGMTKRRRPLGAGRGLPDLDARNAL
jgi:hypothetical protein